MARKPTQPPAQSSDAPVSPPADFFLEGSQAPQQPPAEPLDPAAIAAELLLEKAARSHHRALTALNTKPLVVVIAVPSPTYSRHVEQAFNRLYVDEPSDSKTGTGTPPGQPLFLVADDGRRGRGDSARDLTLATMAGMSVVGIAPDPEVELPEHLVEIADIRFTVDRIGPDILAATIIAVTGEQPEMVDDELCASLELDALRLAITSKGGAGLAVKRLRNLAGANARKKASDADEGPGLDDLHGYGAAKEWGLTLASDLRDYRDGRIPWADVDRGMLLSGPPGTGKTSFARALTKTCGVPLVVGTLAEWQAAGHLGDLLRAMRRTFADARGQAPCILFVDEIDAFGDRASLDRDNRDYGIQVVNGFLEELDGAKSREGVVVIGACNNPHRIDPAIRRAGRLDRLIKIERPTNDELRLILRFHLGKDLPDTDLAPLALAGSGGTGADAELWVRGARRRARKARRAMVPADLLGEITQGAAAMSKADLLRAAVHEAGHVLATLEFGGSVSDVALVDGGAKAGVARTRLGCSPLPTREELWRHVIVLLAGRAAEHTLLGEPSASAGGGPDSDLAMATGLVVDMLSSYGFGHGLVWRPRRPGDDPTDLLAGQPDLRRQADAMLRRAYGEALAMMTLRAGAVRRLGEELVRRRYLDAEALTGLLGTGLGAGPGPDLLAGYIGKELETSR